MVKKWVASKLSILDWLFIGTLLVIFGGVVLHAPLSVGFSALFPNESLIIKSWKEILLGLALVLSVVILTQKRQWALIQDKLIYLIALFAALNLLTIPLFYMALKRLWRGYLLTYASSYSLCLCMWQ